MCCKEGWWHGKHGGTIFKHHITGNNSDQQSGSKQVCDAGPNPRNKIPPEPLKVLDKCKCIRILILHAEFNSYDISVCNHNDPCTQVIDKDDGEDNTDSEAV